MDYGPGQLFHDYKRLIRPDSPKNRYYMTLSLVLGNSSRHINGYFWKCAELCVCSNHIGLEFYGAHIIEITEGNLSEMNNIGNIYEFINANKKNTKYNYEFESKRKLII